MMFPLVLVLLIADSRGLLSNDVGAEEAGPLQPTRPSLHGLTHVHRRLFGDHEGGDWAEDKGGPCYGGPWGDKKGGPWHDGGDWGDEKGPPHKPCKGVPRATGPAPGGASSTSANPSSTPSLPPVSPSTPPTPTSPPAPPPTPPPPPSPPFFPQLPGLATHALAIGNFNPKSKAYNDPEVYSTATSTWTGIPRPMQLECQLLLLQTGQIMCASGVFFTPTTSADVGYHAAYTQTLLYFPNNGTWYVRGPMNEARLDFNLVLLTSGQVLAVGGNRFIVYPGQPYSPALSSAEIFNPASRDWSLTGSMLVARDAFQLVALPDGTALACGGNVSVAAVATCELYDPASETFTSTGSMTTGRVRFKMLLLPGTGQVLAAGGYSSVTSGSPALNSAEIYSPATRTWAAVSSMGTARAAFGMVTFGGAVLAAGGYSSGSTTASSEIYNVSTRSWAATKPLISSRGGVEFHMVSLNTAAGQPLALAVGGTGGASYDYSAEVFSLQSPGLYSSGMWKSTASVWLNELPIGGLVAF